jgi:hypothetical protein
MSAIEYDQMTISVLSFSPREERVGREPERGAIRQNAPPLPGPLLHVTEEREKNHHVAPERIATNMICPSTLNLQRSTS